MPAKASPLPAEPSQWYETVAMPALLRGARNAYGSAIRVALADAGIDDMPRNGPFVVGSIARDGTPLSEVISYLGLSKQRSGQLVDTLVLRGYLERTLDTDDRRRMTVTLTERGKLAANVGRKAVESVDTALEAGVGAATVKQARIALGALIALGE
jgi:DNA-binding MarR family transcriptional regulator